MLDKLHCRGPGGLSDPGLEPGQSLHFTWLTGCVVRLGDVSPPLAKLREGCPRVRAGVRVGRHGSGAAKHSHAMRGILAEP